MESVGLYSFNCNCAVSNTCMKGCNILERRQIVTDSTALGTYYNVPFCKWSRKKGNILKYIYMNGCNAPERKQLVTGWTALVHNTMLHFINGL